MSRPTLDQRSAVVLWSELHRRGVDCDPERNDLAGAVREVIEFRRANSFWARARRALRRRLGLSPA